MKSSKKYTTEEELAEHFDKALDALTENVDEENISEDCESSGEIYKDTVPSSNDQANGVQNDSETIEELKKQIADLKEMIRIRTEEQERLTREIGEFSELFPEKTLEDIPESIWQDVRRGIPLAAAYALLEKKKQLETEKAYNVNKRNARLSAGMVGVGTSSEYFTPDEVRAMSRSEVRENYAKIIESMKKWN